MTAETDRRTVLHGLGAVAGVMLPRTPAFAALGREGICSTDRGQGTMLGDAVARDINAHANRLFDTPLVRDARKRVAELFAADRSALIDGQRSLIQTAADAHVYYATQVAVCEHRDAPGLIWSLAPPVNWGGMRVHDSRFGIENPDNAYRMSALDPAKRYRLTGRFDGLPPSDFSLTALPTAPGDKILANSNAIIDLDNIDVGADGRFTVLLEAAATDGRRNHLDITGSHFLMVRSTMGDWAHQTPGYLSLELAVGHLPRRAMLRPGAEQRAAQFGYDLAEFFLRKLQHGYYERRPVNAFPPKPEPSGQNGGMPTQAAINGYYALGPDEAMIIDASLEGAGYLGVQLCDMWMLSYPYWNATSSLNSHQAVADTDGRIRMVISARDPGVYNWLDSGGHSSGTLTLRWQRIPKQANLGESVCHISRVPLASLRSLLPDDTRFATQTERAQQRAQRACEYARRLA